MKVESLLTLCVTLPRSQFPLPLMAALLDVWIIDSW